MGANRPPGVPAAYDMEPRASLSRNTRGSRPSVSAPTRLRCVIGSTPPTSPGACGKQDSAVGPAASKFLADQMPNGRRHLNSWAFTAERQPRTDREHPCNEFHRNDAKRRLRHFLVQHRLDVWDSAP